MFKREILDELRQWASHVNRKPLLLRGARQVGKTTLVKAFGEEFDQFVYVNLEKPEDAQLFENFTNVEKLLQALFFLKKKRLNGGSTLLFIDEIQFVPAAIRQLRYLYEEAPHIHVIAAGSLLETLIAKDISFPVGRLEYRVVRPFSFKEYLMAMGESILLDALKEIPCPDYIYDQLFDFFHQYLLIGGMPEIIQNYEASKDLTQLINIYESLLVGYMDDVEKYARSQSMIPIMRHALNSIFIEAGNRIKFERFGNSNYKSREMGEALRTLEKAMLMHLVYPTSAMTLPINPNLKKSPRLQVVDTGLMNYFAGLQPSIIRSTDLQLLNGGKIIEHIVGQELLARKYNVFNHLNFWVREKRDSSAEIDYLLPYQGMLIPIEVKAGSTGRLKSLHIFMDQVEHLYAVRIYKGPVKIDRLKTMNGKSYYLLNLPYPLTYIVEDYIDWMMGEVG